MLQGTWPDIVYSTGLYAIGSVLLAIALQSATPVPGAVSIPQRFLFAAGGLTLMFPATLMIDLIGAMLAICAAAWFALTKSRRSGVG